MADRIFVLDQGRIIESGSHGQLMQLRGKYAHLFEKQAQYYEKVQVVQEVKKVQGV
jgi:ATP-binding cassette subfamily B protein